MPPLRHCKINTFCSIIVPPRQINSNLYHLEQSRQSAVRFATAAGDTGICNCGFEAIIGKHTRYPAFLGKEGLMFAEIGQISAKYSK